MPRQRALLKKISDDRLEGVTQCDTAFCRTLSNSSELGWLLCFSARPLTMFQREPRPLWLLLTVAADLNSEYVTCLHSTTIPESNGDETQDTPDMAWSRNSGNQKGGPRENKLSLFVSWTELPLGCCTRSKIVSAQSASPTIRFSL